MHSHIGSIPHYPPEERHRGLPHSPAGLGPFSRREGASRRVPGIEGEMTASQLSTWPGRDVTTLCALLLTFERGRGAERGWRGPPGLLPPPFESSATADPSLWHGPRTMPSTSALRTECRKRATVRNSASLFERPLVRVLPPRSDKHSMQQVPAVAYGRESVSPGWLFGCACVLGCRMGNDSRPHSSLPDGAGGGPSASRKARNQSDSGA